MEKTDQAVAKIIEAINALASQHAAAGVDLALTAMQAKAIASCVLWVVIMAIAVYLARISIDKMLTVWEASKNSEAPAAGSIVAITSFAIFAISIPVAIISGPTVVMTAIDPKLGLAMRVIEKVL